MLGHIAPYMEPSISPSTNMEAAFGRLHNSGAGAEGARPTVVESIVVDGEIDGSMYGATYPSIYGSENGARNNSPSGRIINSGERIIVRPLYFFWFLQFWLRIGSPWLPTARYSVTTKRNTSTNLFNHLPSPRNPIFGPKIQKISKIRKNCKVIFSG